MVSKFEKAVTELVLIKRREVGISAEQLGDISGIGDYIYQIESMRRSYNLDHINKISKALNCSPRDLIPQQYITEEN